MEEVENLSLLFPFPTQKKGDSKKYEVDEKFQIHNNLFILCKGDRQKMEWFYENKTEADLVLMIYLNNMNQGVWDE
jgi:hypothetical protein